MGSTGEGKYLAKITKNRDGEKTVTVFGWGKDGVGRGGGAVVRRRRGWKFLGVCKTRRLKKDTFANMTIFFMILFFNR